MTTEQFEDSVYNAAVLRCGLRPGARLVVALSGGADSVALLAALTARGFECVAAHCNFRLRGDESTRDMEHAVAVADALGVDVSVKHFDVEAHRRATGQSVEMACRELRYRWFERLLEQTHSAAVAVAHHREDQVETVLLNLMRGTGVAGLTGMAWLSGHVARPMLHLSRTDVEQYLTGRGIGWVVDSTNAQNEYRRNRLRNIIIPAMEQGFPGASDAILTTAENLRDTERLCRYAVDTLGRAYVHNNGSLVDIAALVATVPAHTAPALLYEMLKPMGFNKTQILNILDSADSTEGAAFDSPTHRAVLSRGALHVEARAEHAAAVPGSYEVSVNRDILSPIYIAVSHHNIAEFKPERNPNVMYLDERALTKGRFTLRHWRRGDRMQPYGMEGTRLLSDIFSGAKLSPLQKEQTWILERNGTILWVPGLRASGHFAVTPRTKRYLRLEFRP